MNEEFVEIAGIKWATKNVGAEKETDTGLYFQWGDTQGYAADEIGTGEDEKFFNWQSYKHGNGTTDITKYNNVDGKVVLEASDDAVTAAWGDDWRMPTIDEFVALCNSVNASWTYNYKGSGVAGLVYTDKKDSSKVLFFPACGYCRNGSVYDVGSIGNYWSSSLISNNVYKADLLFSNSVIMGWPYFNDRSGGFPIRGVIKKNEKRKLWIKSLLKSLVLSGQQKTLVRKRK